MTKIITVFKHSKKLLMGTTLTLVLAMAMVVGMPHASAESPDILVGSNLAYGSTGAEVSVLQGLMSELGYLQIPIGVSKGYYGSLTQAAVRRYQASRGVTSEIGIFGPASKIAMHEHFLAQNWLSMLGW